MTDKEQVICKYKFKNKEKFNGKPYCLCHNELCEDLFYVCDHNCQIYEDYKQLISKTQECEELKERLERTEDNLKYQCADCMNVKSDRYRKALEEIEELCKKILGNFHHYSQGSVNTAEKILDIINKAKGEEE